MRESLERVVKGIFANPHIVTTVVEMLLQARDMFSQRHIADKLVASCNITWEIREDIGEYV